MRGDWGETYCPLFLVEEVLGLGPATEEEDGLANGLASSRLCGAFLDEGAERSNTGPWADHDDRLGWVGRQLEVRVADVDGDVDTIVFISWAGDFVGEPVWVWVQVALLLLLKCQEVICGDALERLGARWEINGLDNGSDGDLVLLNQR